MRIAQISPLYESVPPKEYGGTERVVSFLTDELVRTGHDVTLFASGDSVTPARLAPMTARALRLAPNSIIHYHIDYLHFPFSRRMAVPTVTTLHGRLDIADLQPLYTEFRDIPVVSISDSQRVPLPQANWQRTIHHGLPEDLYSPGDGSGGYLLFVGRISPEKRVDRAVEIARRAGCRLRVAAKVDAADKEYFRDEIEPLFKEPFVDFMGEVGEDQKGDLLGNARALLFPIDWREPFGLVMIEAMACGTPVIAWPEGSVPEVLAHGLTGYLVTALEDAVDAVSRASALDRTKIRREFEKRFTVERMCRDYLEVYEALAGRGEPAPRPRDVMPA